MQEMETDQDTWSKYREVTISKNETRKAKVPLELYLTEDVKDKKFFKYINNQRKTKEHV